MKKIIITLALAAASIVCANAQVRIEGALTTTSYAFKSGQENIISKNGLGPAGRIFYYLESTSNFGLEIGAGYTGRSTVLNSLSILSTNIDTNVSTSTIEVPIHGYYNIKIGRILAITPMIGLYADYHIGGKLVTGTSSASVNGNPFEGYPYLKKFNFGTDNELLITIAETFTVGAGIQYSFLNMCAKSEDPAIIPCTAYFAVGVKF